MPASFRSVFLTILAALSILSTGPAHGGGWETSGAPPLPYSPKGEQNFVCDVEASLSETREGSSDYEYKTVRRQYRLKTEDFHFGGPTVELKGADGWTVEERGERGRVTGTHIETPEWIDGSSFHLRFFMDRKKSQENLSLGIHTQLPTLSVQTASAESDSSVPSQGGVISAAATVRVESPRNENGDYAHKSMHMRVTCEKQK